MLIFLSALDKDFANNNIMSLVQNVIRVIALSVIVVLGVFFHIPNLLGHCQPACIYLVMQELATSKYANVYLKTYLVIQPFTEFCKISQTFVVCLYCRWGVIRCIVTGML